MGMMSSTDPDCFLNLCREEIISLKQLPADGHKPGDITDIPRATSDPVKAAENKRVSSRFIEDGSYLRVKNLTLGYTFNKGLIS